MYTYIIVFVLLYRRFRIILKKKSQIIDCLGFRAKSHLITYANSHHKTHVASNYVNIYHVKKYKANQLCLHTTYQCGYKLWSAHLQLTSNGKDIYLSIHCDLF